MRTRAATAYEIDEAVVIEELEPDPPKASEVLVKLRASSVCQSN